MRVAKTIIRLQLRVLIKDFRFFSVRYHLKWFLPLEIFLWYSRKRLNMYGRRWKNRWTVLKRSRIIDILFSIDSIGLKHNRLLATVCCVFSVALFVYYVFLSFFGSNEEDKNLQIIVWVHSHFHSGHYIRFLCFSSIEYSFFVENACFKWICCF